jgi:DNA-binding response OmpR family regulator
LPIRPVSVDPTVPERQQLDHELRVIMNRVLLADHDDNLLATYREFLLRDGFDVVTATDGLDCVAKLRSFRPEALVMDADLPWGRGEGVLAMMYEDPKVPLIPVLVLAGSHHPEGRLELGVFPVSAYHVKPLAPYRLAQSLRRLLRRDYAGAEVHWTTTDLGCDVARLPTWPAKSGSK